MKRNSTLALLSLLFLGAQAQYCSPSFVSGCSLWQNQSVNIGSIAWTLGITDCSISDYTDQVTDIVPGVATSMSVTNGHWCGCAVWVDLDQSGSFEDQELQYSSYVGGDPSYTYTFTITLPANTQPGEYRMRVVAPWGSDGVSVGANGYGPCGAYQYGNFNDFTLNVAGNTGITTQNAPMMWLGPNPTEGSFDLMLNDAAVGRTIEVVSVDGRTMLQWPITTRDGLVHMDISTLPAGVYEVRYLLASGQQRMARVVKR